MRALVGILLLTTVFASASHGPQVAAIIQKVTKDLGPAFQTQDNSQLTMICQSGLTTYLQQFLDNPNIPIELRTQLAAVFAGLAQCLNPMCSLVNSPCWTDFQTNLPSDNCVPGFAQATSVLNDLCTNGCFTQLDSVVVTSAQCFANWAAQNGGTASGSGLDFSDINLNQMSAASNLLCMQNPGDDVFCVARLSASATLLVDTSNIADPANCPYFASLGCCATGLELLLGVFNGTTNNGCGSAVAPFTPSQYRQALVACGLGSVAQCPLIGAIAKIGVINWVIDHIDFTAWNALSAQAKLDFLYALRTDFANSTGIARDVVSVGVIIQAATGINVKFILHAVTDLLTQTNFDNYKAYITGTTPQFPALTQFASAHSGLSTGAVQFNSAESSDSLSTQSGGGGSSGATSAMLSFGAIVLAIVSAVFA